MPCQSYRSFDNLVAACCGCVLIHYFEDMINLVFEFEWRSELLYSPNIPQAVMICGIKTEPVVFSLTEK